MDEEPTKTWIVHRRYNGMVYFAPFTSVEADSSAEAMQELARRIEREGHRWRAFESGEVLVLKTTHAEALHLVRITHSVIVERF